MAKYQQYEEYKDSGVEWLGDIPSHWEAKRLGQFFKERREKVSDKDYAALSVTMKGIVPQLENAAKSDAGDNRKLVLKNDFVINSRSDRKGSSGTSPFDGSVSLISIVLEPRDISPRFVHHLLRSYPFQEEFYRYGKGIVADLWSTNSSEMKNILIPNIPIDEQTQIANFLDYETAQIDTLIDKQQTLIQLLKEKRQAVISHAVTKGLNPDAPMKDSGVEWLGEVPEHWEVKRIKHYGRIIGGFAFKSDDFIDSGYPVLKISNVSHLQLNFDDESFLPPSFVERHLEYKVEENDLVFAMTRPIISGGIKIAKIPKLEAMPLVNQRVGFLKLKSELLADFILYSSLSSSFKAQFKNNMTITNQPNISGEGIESVALPMPPKNELVEIVDFLNNSETVFQNLSIKSEQQVELLKERRTALISAAVTGKIDVRGWVVPE